VTAPQIVVLIHSQTISDQVRHLVCIQPHQRVRDLCGDLAHQIISQGHHNPVTDIPDHGMTTDFILLPSRKCMDKPLNCKLNMDLPMSAIMKELGYQAKQERITLHAYKPQDQSQWSQIFGNMSSKSKRDSLEDIFET